MEDIVFYESLKIAEWKKDKFQSLYNSKLEEITSDFIEYVNKNSYGEIDIRNKYINITYNDGDQSTDG
tara:strand:+ start:1798 stop:2001 length:204 start_codon:yes stop_codon:yes gene_type:complete